MLAGCLSWWVREGDDGDGDGDGDVGVERIGEGGWC
jgi:hypothetical protein